MSLLILGTLTISGCHGEAPPTTSHGTFTLDATTQKIALPLDAYYISSEENRDISFANDIAVYECMMSRGQHRSIPVRLAAGGYGLNYGVWDLAWADRHGYRDVQPPDGPAPYSPDEGSPAETVFTACTKSPDVTRTLFDEHAYDVGFEGVQASTNTTAGKAAIAEWGSCLSSAGVTPPDLSMVTLGSGWEPQGATELSLESQISMAEKDVACKIKVRLVSRLARIDADAQQSAIDTHEAQLAQYRAAWQKVLTDDRTIIARFTAAHSS